ncbi:MAG TPA: hypothetical protein VES67_07280 [Vicinamibacterales bacterium]|nr:hypothetical protein [Vicinamibacterales bacterium]
MQEPVPVVEIPVPEWRWAITTAIAIYAAVLASYHAYIAWRDKRVNIRATLFTSMVAVSPGSKPVPHLSLVVENHGFLPATFSQTCGSLVVQGQKNRFLSAKPLTDVPSWPHVIQPGTSFFVGFEKSKLFPELQKAGVTFPARVRGAAVDQINRVYYSKWVNLSDKDA